MDDLKDRLREGIADADRAGEQWNFDRDLIVEAVDRIEQLEAELAAFIACKQHRRGTDVHGRHYDSFAWNITALNSTRERALKDTNHVG